MQVEHSYKNRIRTENVTSKYKFRPHSGKQTEFLKSTSNWIFYGGARGGGKSLMLAWKAALIPRAWHYERLRRKIDPEQAKLFKAEGKSVQTIVDAVSIDFSDYIGILMRRTFPQLERNLKPECDKLYKLYGATWQERNKCYVFPSGAKIYLVHCQDMFDFKSRKYRAYMA